MTTTFANPLPAPVKNCGPHIAVLDANPAVLDYLRRILSDRCRLSLFTHVPELLVCLGESVPPDLVLLDWHIPWHIASHIPGQTAVPANSHTPDPADAGNSQANALGLLEKIRASRPRLPVVMMACSADLKDMILATRMGATDIVLKPFRKRDIDLIVQPFIDRAASASVQVDEIPLDENTSFVRSSKRMREIESQCCLVSRTGIPVLILGETGTGKEIAAMYIHKMSARSERSFLKVNCAAMPLDLLESELFGYEQGAFTGAVKSKPGKFEICDKGTIFLDEIGEMPTALQAKLLQVLQDGSFSRLGSRNTVKVDVRVIAATNIDIKASIAQKAFREDLYYRLNGFCINMPPLRERRDEIPVFAHYFMRRISEKFGRELLPISPALLRALAAHPWPGNLRELENTIKRYVVLADENAIISDLNPHRALDSSLPVGEESGAGGLKRLVRGLKDDAESTVIAQTLEGTGWNRKAAASELQISYKALLYKIKQYNLRQPNMA
jgi:DNA-binding NtrC family response regulator